MPLQDDTRKDMPQERPFALEDMFNAGVGGVSC